MEFWSLHVFKCRTVASILCLTLFRRALAAKFIGAELMSSDLRASVALVLAAIVSNGKSYINRIYHLDRGYEKIENKLKKIGVKIKRLK